MRVLLLCDYRPDGASTVLEHIHAIERFCGHDVDRLPMLGDIPDALDLKRYDAVVVHYSLVISNDTYLSPLARHRLRRYPGLKLVFIQDEYRWVNKTIDALRYLKVHVLFTCVPPGEIKSVYDPNRLPGLHTVNVLTGYVSDALLTRSVPGYDKRHIDVGYRGRKISAAYGKLGLEKWQIVGKFLDATIDYDLRCDVSYQERDRLYGERWNDFISSCKAMLGVESGANVFDWDGEMMPAVMEAEQADPSRSYASLEAEFFPAQDGQIQMNQISPRCFESAALRTLMVLYEGEYSGVLEAWRHYVPLKKDFSNIEEVVGAIRNRDTWNRITDFAYTEIANNPAYGFARFGEMVGSVMSEQLERLEWRAEITDGTVDIAELINDSMSEVTSKLTRVNRLSALHNIFERRVLANIPERAVSLVEKAARFIYHLTLRAYQLGRKPRRIWSVMQKFRGAVGNATIPPRFYLRFWVASQRLEEELETLFRLQSFGRTALMVNGRREFQIRLCERDPCLVIEPAEALTNVSRDVPHNAPISNELASSIRDVRVRLEDPESKGLEIGGVPNRSLPEITRLFQLQPSAGIALLENATSSIAWFGQWVIGDDTKPCI